MPYEKTIIKKGIPEWIPFYMDYRNLKRLISPFSVLQKGEKFKLSLFTIDSKLTKEKKI